MHKLAVAVALTLLAPALSACCSSGDARFWKVRDAASGKVAYAVDTVAVPLGEIDDHYLDGNGRLTRVARPEVVGEMTRDQWESETSGGDFSVHYCPVRKACWASAHEK